MLNNGFETQQGSILQMASRGPFYVLIIMMHT